MDPRTSSGGSSAGLDELSHLALATPPPGPEGEPHGGQVLLHEARAERERVALTIETFLRMIKPDYDASVAAQQQQQQQ